jgi:hypothetical protein
MGSFVNTVYSFAKHTDWINNAILSSIAVCTVQKAK